MTQIEEKHIDWDFLELTLNAACEYFFFLKAWTKKDRPRYLIIESSAHFMVW